MGGPRSSGAAQPDMSPCQGAGEPVAMWNVRAGTLRSPSDLHMSTMATAGKHRETEGFKKKKIQLLA